MVQNGQSYVVGNVVNAITTSLIHYEIHMQGLYQLSIESNQRNDTRFHQRDEILYFMVSMVSILGKGF